MHDNKIGGDGAVFVDGDDGGADNDGDDGDADNDGDDGGADNDGDIDYVVDSDEDGDDDRDNGGADTTLTVWDLWKDPVGVAALLDVWGEKLGGPRAGV